MNKNLISRMSLRNKLVSTAIIPIIGLSFFMYFSSTGVSELGEHLSVAHEQLIPNIESYQGALTERISFGYYAFQVMNTPESNKRLESIEKLEKAWSEFRRYFHASQVAPNQPGEEEIMKPVYQHAEEFNEASLDIIKLLKANDPKNYDEVVKSLTVGKWQTLAKEFRLTSTKVLEMYLKVSQEENLTQKIIHEKITIRLYIIYVSVIIFNIVILFILGNLISKGLLQMSVTLGAGADKVAEASAQTVNASNSLSSSVTEQAAALQETSSSVEETSAMINKNATNAKQSIEVAQRCQAVVRNGKESVEQVIISIQEIATSNQQILDQVEDGNNEMKKIEDIISQIANKTKIINEIVFQTKLLSFNASVEAARAGEYGKGFSVVAEEIAKLAQISGNSANEIGIMLEESTRKVEEISQNTKNKVDILIKSGKETINTGIATANKCNKALDEIVENVSEVNGLIHEISTASQEQAQGVLEINKAIIELDNVADQNNQTSQDVAHSAGELQSQVEVIRKIIIELNTSITGEGKA